MRETARLLAALTGARVVGSLPATVDALAGDSRAVRPGTLFVALRGERTDGHAYVRDAAARGAAAVVVERASDADVPAIVVPDTRVAAAVLADAFYDEPSAALTVVGVTGTNGKTTTTHLVRDVFEAAGMRCGVIGTLGGALGERRWPLSNTTPLAIELQALLAEQRDAGARAVAMEVSSHALALRRVDRVRFRAAALTNITRDHLDFHGTLERYVAAKRTLFDLAPVAVLNADDPSGAAFARELPNAITYALDADADVRATAIVLEGDGTSFRVGDVEVTIALPGRFNVRNALAAFALGRVLGIDDATIARGLARTRSVPGRMERIGAFGIDAIVDYAHTPDALENVLCAAREATKRELIVVFGCGGDRDPGKRAQMGEIAARLADRVIVTSDNPRGEDPLSIARAVADGYPHTTIELDRRSAIRRAIDAAQPGDTIVVAGKGHETYQIVGSEVRPFDDRDEVRLAFSKRAEALRA
ncbi:MAG TPA: UDP-N-acetylmuramoyl-L-alanyl-D-glutamate--2,6-diaminopimelate ligase [Candidatus Baltobacteraceae bacterium]|nr:UDP-N-acetylmuramoyl-L-alanyl-D-glutamate--2,6-diaminopimelate ligase [Candidatus Baltobacteraceae bacterium]